MHQNLQVKKDYQNLLFNVGGEAFEQSVKQTIKASIGQLFQLLVIYWIFT